MRGRLAIMVCAATALLAAGCGSKSDPLANGSTTSGVVTTAPATTTATVAPSTKPGHAPAFGVSASYWGLQHTGAADQAALADFTRAAGGTVLRIPVPWYLAEPYPPYKGDSGQFSFKQFAALKAAMKRDGIRPLPVILGTPNWALPQPWHCPTAANCDGGPAPDHLKDLSAFTEALVKEFPDAIAIEAYNEVNTALNWGPIPVDVKKYAKALATVHDAVRAAHSAIPVLTSGLVNFKQPFPGDMDAPEFLDALYKAGAKGSFEGISLHPYESTDDPSKPGGFWLSRIAAARAVAKANGDAGRPIWITESGYPTGGTPTWTTVLSEAQQSRQERCAYQLLVGAPDIVLVLHNSLFDTQPVGKSNALDDHSGLFHSDRSPKPIVAAMAHMLAHPSKVTNCSAVH